ncbi:hypothetical protein COU14_00490 [Candidatus Kaiserbacteria bacterium CG10_big_fil_rev_8_21_14_0_10_44_10]|uniref:DUF2914 domain-containing protein n=1 Tax=Candidatus Kaiserbacteria bacterium CG10_big_fil_rev_8_21_14_0_10_44_10 TaxID=1974606 RepID=A0A2H0UI94_9BACT|nr:MAG: hypothetical protein COU14_00490 [Candidatus Kaiserbacteria bacterium CG10_big_fil_rev_8_21_14_0_10_44_10]
MNSRLKAITNSKSFLQVKRHWLTIAFLAGFITDLILLNKVDSLVDNLVLLFYVLLAMTGIIFLYASAAGKMPEGLNGYVKTYSPLILQYAFGGLLSGMLIFYGRSASLVDSWPFLLLIAVIIYLNETVRERSGRLVLTLSMFFIGLFSYVILVVPTFTGLMGAWIFVGSGILSLIIMAIFLWCLRFVIPNFLALQMRLVVFSLGTIFVLLNFLYFLNIIPPIPLSIKDIGIYHSVVRFENGDYQLKYEDGSWWHFWKRSDTTFHPEPGGNAFCFTRVFTPTRLDTEVYHRWEYYDQEEGWVTHARVHYPIFGGRDNGYRGYTQIGSVRDGKWRCTVETARGQVLGREKFEIDSTQSPDDLVTRVD